MVPMAPRGPGYRFPARNQPNGGTATHLVTLLIFARFLARSWCCSSITFVAAASLVLEDHHWCCRTITGPAGPSLVLREDHWSCSSITGVAAAAVVWQEQIKKKTEGGFKTLRTQNGRGGTTRYRILVAGSAKSPKRTNTGENRRFR